MVVFGSILIVVVYIVIMVYAAKRFQKIAEMKGHRENCYFWWCFWTGPIGMMMVIALPDRRSGSAGESLPVLDEIPDL